MPFFDHIIYRTQLQNQIARYQRNRISAAALFQAFNTKKEC
jgi:hypothetical protein